MTKLNQIIAVLGGIKNTTQQEQAKVYQLAQKSALFQGLTRTFAPKAEEGYVYPSENQMVQMTVSKAIAAFVSASSEFLDVALTQDTANTKAVVDLVVEGQVIAAAVPVTNLLFLEDRIQDYKAFVNGLPSLAIDKEWEYDRNKGVYRSTPRETTKTKKTQEFVIVCEPTKEHPAQIREITTDAVEGIWTATELSGALPSDEKAAILKRIDLLQQAVLKARQEANSIEVVEKKIASDLFSYIFGSIV
jgi:hypothetical protein